MKAKKIKITLYILLLTMFLVYLFVINDVVLLGKLQPKRIDDKTILEKGLVISNIDQCYAMNDNLESVWFQGWAFIESNLPLNNREIGIVLSGQKENKYLCTTRDIIYKDGVYESYSPQYKLSYGEDYGFMFHFSTLKLPDDQYDIGVYCYDNYETFGVDWKGLVLIKHGKDVYITKKTSKAFDKVSISSIDELAECNIDLIRTNEDYSVTIEGWAFVPNCDTVNQEKYIVLSYEDGTSLLYSTFPITRTDVAKAFLNNMYTPSGFCAEIPAELLHSNTFTTYIIVRDDKGWHTSSDMIEKIITIFEKLAE